jgi:hypothetical protein
VSAGGAAFVARLGADLPDVEGEIALGIAFAAAVVDEDDIELASEDAAGALWAGALPLADAEGTLAALWAASKLPAKTSAAEDRSINNAAKRNNLFITTTPKHL